jgi:hypothetical protein
MQSFLGLPLQIWGFMCYVVSAVWIFVWPRPKPEKPARSFGLNFVLHWFHPLAWVLLGTAGLFSAESGSTAAVFLALAALAVFLGFMVALYYDSQVEQKA